MVKRKRKKREPVRNESNNYGYNEPGMQDYTKEVKANHWDIDRLGRQIQFGDVLVYTKADYNKDSKSHHLAVVVKETREGIYYCMNVKSKQYLNSYESVYMKFGVNDNLVIVYPYISLTRIQMNYGVFIMERMYSWYNPYFRMW